MKEFWVVIGQVNRLSKALAEKCRELAALKGLKLRVISVESEGPEYTKPVVDRLTELYTEAGPEAIIFECTAFLSAAAPAFAVRIGRGITADCTELRWDDTNGLLQIRPTFGGRKIAVNRSTAKPYIATVRQGAFSADKYSVEAELPELEYLNTGLKDERIVLRSFLSEMIEKNDIHSSEIILSGGMGLGSRENYARLAELAERLGVGLGASRAAVAAGYTDYSRQVGQTGSIVRPKLYVAFGISGAVQHLSGIMGAEKIAAVNTDPAAPIHRYSDYSVIADCNQVIAAMHRILDER